MASDYPELCLYIDGQRLGATGRSTRSVVNPATEEPLGLLPHATPEDLDTALDAAARCATPWQNRSPDERSRILRGAAALIRERGERLARLATLESGKPIVQTRIEVEMAAAIFEWYAEEGRRAYGRVLARQAPGTRMLVVKQPVGPVAGFAPWNFPLGNPARKLGAPLAAGCPCILKAAEETPAAALGIVECLADAGLPAGVASLVFGVPEEISSHLIGSSVIRAITFTGSVPVGKQLMRLAADGMKRTTMELGGHAPVIVCRDVDLNGVLEMSVAAKFRNAGQVCVSPSRFIVHDSLYEDFVAGFAERVGRITVGDGLDEANTMGPLIHERRLRDVTALVDDAGEQGARVVCGGERLFNRGYFYAPTVLADVPVTARAMQEEPFAPIALINPFTELDQAIVEANRLPYGLAAFGFSQSAAVTRRLGDELEAGMVGINSFAISVPASPFGGIKESGHGSEEGIEGLDDMLITKFISEA